MGLGDRAYTPKRDGTIDEFLARTEQGTSALFKGPKHYTLLWNEGLLHPDLSTIRINNPFGGEHEHYTVVDGQHIEGVTSFSMYNGVRGVHAIERFLRGERAYFEAHGFVLGDEQFREVLRRQRRKCP